MKRKSVNVDQGIQRLRPTVVGAGLVALDVVIDHTTSTQDASYFAGGTCGNVLTILSYLGWDSKPIARLKPGASTDLLIGDLERWGVDPAYLTQDADGSTPVIIQNNRELKDGSRTHSFSLRCPCCNAYLPGYKSILGQTACQIAESIPAHQVFFFDRVSRGTLNLARASAKLGAVIVFEPSGVCEPRLFKEAWSIANVVKYSNERLRDIADLNLQQTDCPGLLLEIETLGEDGLRFRSNLNSNRSWRSLKSIPVSRFRDAAGSGDWCTAGVLQKLAKAGVKKLKSTTAAQLEEALKYGQALATWNCSFDAARGGMYKFSRQDFDRHVKQLLSGKSVRMREEAIDSPVKELSQLCPTCESAKFTNQRKTCTAS